MQNSWGEDKRRGVKRAKKEQLTEEKNGGGKGEKLNGVAREK